jgi:hypothetical protein
LKEVAGAAAGYGATSQVPRCGGERSRWFGGCGRGGTGARRIREFLRRFVQHILPRGFVRIRQSGFLASTGRTTRVALARTLLSAARTPVATPSTATEAPTVATWACPRCGAAMILGPILSALQLMTFTLGFDSS